jgi:hypothetical protein
VGISGASIIYDDDLSPVPTLKANPFFSNTDGYFEFYAPNGRYDVVISNGVPAIPVPYTWADINLGLGDCGPASTLFGSLPLPGLPHTGRMRYVPDAAGGVYIDTGTEWVALLGFGFPVVPFANLPTPGIPGRLRIVSDNVRGIWQDQGSYWFNIFGETVNVQDFGAVGDGSTDDTAAIQAAIDALFRTGGGGQVLIPARTFGITAPLLLRNGTRLAGTSSVGSVIKALSTFAGDSMLRGFSRDDNTISNFEAVSVENLQLTGPAVSPTLFYCIDLTGCHRSVVNNVVAVGGGTAAPNQTALRLADRNPTGTSIKDCIGNRVQAFSALFWNVFCRVIELGPGALNVEDNTLEQFISICRAGIRIGGNIGGVGFSIAGGLLYGDGIPNAGASVAIEGPVPPFTKIDRMQVASPFGDGDGALADFRNTFFLNYPLGIGRSGTNELLPLLPGGTSGPFTGSVNVSIPVGTVLVPGRNVFTFLCPGLSVFPQDISIIASCQGFVFNQQGDSGAANSGDTIFLVIINSSSLPVTLTQPCGFRLIAIA